MNGIITLIVRLGMKQFCYIAMLGFIIHFLSSCATDRSPMNGEGRNRVGYGNADLQGPSADAVIRRSTHQWHADRYYDEHRRSRRW